MSDKGCWLSLADPCGPFTSCQSHGPQRGALPSALPQPGLAQQEAGYRGEAGVLLKLETGDRTENGGSVLMNTRHNLAEFTAIESWHSNENIPNKIYNS